MEMNRIDDLIRNPNVYYDGDVVEGWIKFCENELTLTDGSPLHLLESFKVWGEEIFGWYYFVERSVPEVSPDGRSVRYVNRRIKKRLVNKQYLIVGRGAAKSLYDTCVQAYYLIVDPDTTQQVTTAPTMDQADEVLYPFRTAITKARGDVFKFLTEGSLQNTTGSKMNRMKLASTKKGIENFITGSILKIRPMSIDKLQGLRCKCATVDEWLSGDTRQDVISALEQSASKNLDDWLIVATSSEGTVRNGPGDTIKLELMDILKGEYPNPHVSIWWYRLDDISEDGMEPVRTIADIFSLYDISTEIIAASVRSPGHVTQAALAGADIATVPYKVILQMLKHPLTDQGIEKFRKDYEAAFGE